jgi:hypothetical protein
MIISTSGKTDYVLATQISHNGKHTGTISMVDTIDATTGPLFFNASLTLSFIKAEDQSPVTGTLASRETPKHAEDAWTDTTDTKAADTTPWGTQCEGIEGSKMTKPCGGSLPHRGSTKSNKDRRYVIDETVGSGDMLCAFYSLGNYPDSHEIRLVDGKAK